MFRFWRTPKMGWDGWTPTAGEVNTIPETWDSIFGSSIACKNSLSSHHMVTRGVILTYGYLLTFKMMAPPVEWPTQKQGSPGFSAITFSRNELCRYMVVTCKRCNCWSNDMVYKNVESWLYQISDSIIKRRNISMKSIASTMTCSAKIKNSNE